MASSTPPDPPRPAQSTHTAAPTLLQSRLSELHCLYRIHRVLNEETPLPLALEHIALHLAEAWGNAPELGIHIALDNENFTTGPFERASVCATRSIIVEGLQRGAITLSTSNSNLASTIHDAAGQLLETITVALARNVERLEARLALRESEQRYRHIFNFSQQAIWVLDHHLHTTLVNPALCRLLGSCEDTLEGTRLTDHVDPTLRAFCEQHFLYNAAPDIEPCELILQNKNGHPLYVTVETARIQAEAGGGLLLGLLDITERRQAEEALRTLACAFEAHEAILIANPEGQIERVNQAFIEVTGYAEENVIGENVRILRSDKHDRHFYTRQWNDLLEKGNWSGEVWNRRRNGEDFLCQQTITTVWNRQGHVQHYVATLMDITQRRRDQEKMLQQADYDALTDLPNRRYFRNRLDAFLEEAHASGERGAIMFVDLDKFKHINETMGHHIGDRVLKAVGERLAHCLREEDLIARLGGDEFVILLRHLGKTAAAAESHNRRIAEKILRAFRSPFEVEGERFILGCCLGTTLAPNGPAHSHELLMQADAAMYHAKKIGRHAHCAYTPEIRRKNNERLRLEHRFNEALERDGLTLFYQPQFDDQFRLVGAEALLRWLEDGKTVLSTPEVILLAEHAHLTNALGNWVVRQACNDLRQWRQNGLPPSFQKLSVNISPRQFASERFREEILTSIRESGTSPRDLMLEVTEEALIEDIDTVIEVMIALQAEGLRFALDDFGTGFSPLYYLSRLPLSTLKIDQSFVRNLDNIRTTGIVSSIIALGHKLGFDLIAEGVETSEQLQTLCSFGCRHFQGYLFSKPIPCSAFTKLIEEHRAGNAST